MGNLSIIYRKTSELKPYPRNARTHSRKQVKQIAGAIGEFGFTNPVLLDENDQIIAGHGRVQAAKLSQRRQPVMLAIRPTVFNRYVAAHKITSFTQTFEDNAANCGS